MTIAIRSARSSDAATLAAVAAETFPLACPPHTTKAAIADFIAKNLTEASFARYLGDPQRVLFLAELDDTAVGYTMLVFGEPVDTDAAAAVTVHPTVELSKVYVAQGHHGAGVASALMKASLDAARARAAAGVWLGVNQENERANRFYEKSGFAIVGSKRFLVGERYEDDYVREKLL